jgi:hypothetical protein
MLRALEQDPHRDRLRSLLQNFRAQEVAMQVVLHELQAELEHWHREAIFLRSAAPISAVTMLDRCTELQAECDLLSTELVHVRMAISGTGEELAAHEGHVVRFTAPACRAALA